jgi:hypothetical protein
VEVQRNVWHWWEITQVKLQDEDFEIQWHQTARREYMANAERIGLLRLKARNISEVFGAEEREELKGLERTLGFVSIRPEDFERVVGIKKSGEEEG